MHLTFSNFSCLKSDDSVSTVTSLAAFVYFSLMLLVAIAYSTYLKELISHND